MVKENFTWHSLKERDKEAVWDYGPWGLRHVKKKEKKEWVEDVFGFFRWA